jgi:hypothetical protein
MAPPALAAHATSPCRATIAERGRSCSVARVRRADAQRARRSTACPAGSSSRCPTRRFKARTRAAGSQSRRWRAAGTRRSPSSCVIAHCATCVPLMYDARSLPRGSSRSRFHTPCATSSPRRVSVAWGVWWSSVARAIQTRISGSFESALAWRTSPSRSVGRVQDAATRAHQHDRITKRVCAGRSRNLRGSVLYTGSLRSRH